MPEFVYKGNTLPSIVRFKEGRIRIGEIEASLDAWTKEMTLKYDQEIKYGQLSFGMVGVRNKLHPPSEMCKKWVGRPLFEQIN